MCRHSKCHVPVPRLPPSPPPPPNKNIYIYIHEYAIWVFNAGSEIVIHLLITKWGKNNAQHNGRVARYCHFPLVIWTVHITILKLTSWLWKIGQGHPSSNLTKTLLRYIHGIRLGSMRLIFIDENCKFSCLNRPPWPWKIGQGHPYLNLARHS